MTVHGCRRREGISSWCDAHGARFVAGHGFCWATVRPSDVDPLSAFELEYSRTRPVVDDRAMLLFWVVAALGFLLICALAAYAVGIRVHGG